MGKDLDFYDKGIQCLDGPPRLYERTHQVSAWSIEILMQNFVDFAPRPEEKNESFFEPLKQLDFRIAKCKISKIQLL